MDLGTLLTVRSPGLVDRALASMEARQLQGYQRLGRAETASRLSELALHLADAARRRDFLMLVAHAERIARDRRAAGFELHEVQAAVNALEEAMWVEVRAALPKDAQPDALGWVSALFGAVKDRLATTWVAEVSARRLPPLDLQTLFVGTQNTGGGLR